MQVWSSKPPRGRAYLFGPQLLFLQLKMSTKTYLFQHRKPCSLSKVRVQWLCHLDRRLKLPPRPICSNRSNWGTVRKRSNVYSGHAYGPATGDRKWQSGLISTQQWTSRSLDLKTGGSSCPLGLSQSRPLWGRIFTLPKVELSVKIIQTFAQKGVQPSIDNQYW